MTLLPILLCARSDAKQAEALLDHIAALRGKRPSGNLLLACHDCHEETQNLLRIAGEVGFGHVDVVNFPPSSATKSESVNLFYQKTLSHAARAYRGPFLILEADCVVRGRWLEALTAAYEAQPKLYMGSVLADKNGKQCIGRVGVFPRHAISDIGQLFTSTMPWEIMAAENLVTRATKTKLIQVLPVLTPEDCARMRDDAVLVHGDKNGALLDYVKEQGKPQPQCFIRHEPLTEEVLNGFANGALGSRAIEETPKPPKKLDGRTRAGRRAKMKALQNV